MHLIAYEATYLELAVTDGIIFHYVCLIEEWIVHPKPPCGNISPDTSPNSRDQVIVDVNAHPDSPHPAQSPRTL
jgi:hypothetical protein